MSFVLVFVPAGWFVLGLLVPGIFETAIRTFYIYSFLPSAMFLSYPDVSNKLGIPQTAFGLAVTFLYWFVISLLLGALLGVLRVPYTRTNKRNELTRAGDRSTRAR